MKKYLETADIEWYKQRLSGVIFCAVAAFLLLFVRLFYLQAIQGKEFRRLSENNCIRLQSIDAPRGLLFDRNGELLVDNRPSFNLAIITKDAAPLKDTLKKLSEYTGIPETEFAQKIHKSGNGYSYRPIILKRDIGRDLLAVVEVRKFDLPGVEVQVAPRRQYIEERSAAHMIGYLSEISPEELESGKYPGCRRGDFIGKFGVEKEFEHRLRGERGGQQVEVNATGRVVRVIKTVDPRAGNNLVLTIDNILQQRTEELLSDVTGAAVAMDPQNGEILAMASSPTFDQNAFVSGLSQEYWDSIRNNPNHPMENKAIQGEYPPASTFKIVTAMAGLEEGVIDLNTTMFCPGHYQFGDRLFNCWKKGGHGSVNIEKALAESCDVYFYQVGLKLGIDRLAWYAKACGLGAPSGIQLDHEASGLMPTADWKQKRTGIPWQKGETLSVSIGQGYDLATPIQMMALTAAIANGGSILKPVIVKTVETLEGEKQPVSSRVVSGMLPVSPQNLAIIRKGLWDVVNGPRGTARIARLENVAISGKTGTAQVVGRKKDETETPKNRPRHLKPHAWFVAYAPAEDPKIAIAIIVEHGEHGSSTASPIAREMVKAYLRQGDNG